MKAATYHKIANITKNKTFFEKPVRYYRLDSSIIAEGAYEYIMCYLNFIQFIQNK